jgi:hypothetical protein
MSIIIFRSSSIFTLETESMKTGKIHITIRKRALIASLFLLTKRFSASQFAGVLIVIFTLVTATSAYQNIPPEISLHYFIGGN